MKKLLLPLLMFVAAGVIVYVLLRRRSSPAAAAAPANDGRSLPSFPQTSTDPKNAIQQAISNAQDAAAAIRKDPGLAALLGFDRLATDRLTLSKESFAKIYQQIPQSGFDVVQ